MAAPYGAHVGRKIYFCCINIDGRSIVQFISVSRPTGSSRGHEGRFSGYPLPVFSAEGPCEQFRYGKRCPLFDIVHPAFPLPTTASPILKGALKDGFGEAVVVCDISESCRVPSLDSCQKRSVWTTHKEVDLAPLQVVGNKHRSLQMEILAHFYVFRPVCVCAWCLIC